MLRRVRPSYLGNMFVRTVAPVFGAAVELMVLSFSPR